MTRLPSYESLALAGFLASACVSNPPPVGEQLAAAADDSGADKATPRPTEAAQGRSGTPSADDVEEPEAPKPDTAPPPPGPEEIKGLLEDAHHALKAAGVHKSPAFRSHGRLPDDKLKEAYAEGRAQAFRGRAAQVEGWMAVAKFGGEYDPSGKPTAPRVARNAGPLAGYDLSVVVESEDKAYLHVEVPREGLRSAGGEHRAFVRKQWWTCLSDSLEPGVDYRLYKSNKKASLHRQWAQDWVIERVAELAKSYKASTGERVGIGDMSLVVGGKISDHWTHRLGVDVDFYFLYELEDESGEQKLRHSWHRYKRGVSTWSSDAAGKRDKEIAEDGLTRSDQLLEALARAAVEQDDLHFFVHDSVQVLERFDKQAGERRPGRRFLHAKNRAFWPEHRDHAHLRWTSKKRLPIDVPPRP